jgi:ribonuclease PH
MSTKRTRPDQIRPVTIRPYPTGAAGSVIIAQGDTQVLCTASIAAELPRWLQGKPGQAPTQGWVTAEYAMLPGSTPDRKRRGSDSRGTEIQRLIARVLRASVDLTLMPGVLITCDCDVLAADGGTRTASITGAYVALAQAIASARKQGLIARNPIHGPVAAISVGIVDAAVCADLDYALDHRADVDLNVAMNHRGALIEVQGTAERQTFSRSELDQMLDLAAKGITKLIRTQRKTLRQIAAADDGA